MRFRVGSRLAVVGPNGSGKTTFIKLLCRLYDPTEGQILLNGIDIRKYRYREYMDLFAVVFQDFKLLALPLGENVAARRDYDRERAADCLRKAGFGERLASMPQGLDTYLYKDLDKEGVEVSGGEAQKIAIARALYQDAPFIILDGPWTRWRRRRSTASSTTSPGTRPPSTSATGSPPASSATRLRSLTGERWSSRGGMRTCWRRRTAFTTRCGRHRPSTIHPKRAEPYPKGGPGLEISTA